MSLTFTDWDRDPNYLAHFGVKGMKHGQRRYQNPDGSLTALGRERYGVKGTRSAHGTARDLNKLDRERAYATTRLKSAASKIARKDARYAKKIAKAEESGNTEKVAKLSGKRDDLRKNSSAANKVSAYSKLLNKNKAMTDKILNSAKKSGMNIKTRDTVRITNKGRGIAAAVGAQFAARAARLAARRYFGTGTTGGTKVYGLQAMPAGSKYNGGKVYTQFGEVMRKGGTLYNKSPYERLSGSGKSAVRAGIGVGALATQIRTEKGTKYKVKKRK